MRSAREWEVLHHLVTYVCNKMNDPGLKRVGARVHVILLVVIEGTPYTCLLCL